MLQYQIQITKTYGPQFAYCVNNWVISQHLNRLGVKSLNLVGIYHHFMASRLHCVNYFFHGSQYLSSVGAVTGQVKNSKVLKECRNIWSFMLDDILSPQ